MPNNEHTYGLRHVRNFKTPSVNTAYHDTESVLFLGPKIWEILPNSFEKINKIDTLKKQLKHENLVISLADFAGYIRAVDSEGAERHSGCQLPIIF